MKKKKTKKQGRFLEKFGYFSVGVFANYMLFKPNKRSSKVLLFCIGFLIGVVYYVGPVNIVNCIRGLL